MTEATASDRCFSEDDYAWLSTGPIPAAPFYDPAWFDLERDSAFHRT